MSPTLQLPKFNHPEIEVLYEYDLSIPKEKIERILALPRATLIEDLETAIKDFIERHEYLVEAREEGQWLEIHTHALWILMELKAEEALPTVFDLLQQDKDFSRNYLGDSLTEDYWQILYVLGANSLDQLKTFALRPGHWANRIVATTAVKAIAQHQPEKRTIVIDWYRSLMQELLAMEAKNSALDGDFISSVAVDLIHLHVVELLPQIKLFYDKGLIYNGITGDYTSIEKDIQNSNYSECKQEIPSSIFDRYHSAMTTWHSYLIKYSKTYKEKYTNKKSSDKLSNTPLTPSAEIPFKRIEKKVGRNEPCPCGSGKKYKKCCLKK